MASLLMPSMSSGRAMLTLSAHSGHRRYPHFLVSHPSAYSADTA